MIDSRVDKILNQFLIRRDLPALFDANRQLPLVPHLKKKNIDDVRITILDIRIYIRKSDKETRKEKPSVHCTIIFFYVITIE